MFRIKMTRPRLKESLQDTNGQATLLMAAFLGIVGTGFLAFAVDVGYFFHEKRMAQAANAAAKLNGFDTTLATNPAVVNLSTLTSGNYSTTSSAVPPSWTQATVREPFPTFFLGAFNSRFLNMTVSATAIAAQGQSTSTCVCLEATGGQNLYMSNGSQLSAPTCGVVANSSADNAIGIVGATLGAKTLGTVSNDWDNSSNVNNGGTITSSTKIVQGITTTCSPSMPAAPVDTNCSADPLGSHQGGSTYTVGPNSSAGTTVNGNTVCYNSLTIGANSDTVTLNPGIYVINGGSLTFASGTQRGGDGVFFYLENNASVSIANGANVYLVAPTSGTYSGILFYQAASDTNTMTIAGGANSTISGDLLAPGAQVALSNGSGTTIAGGVVAQTMTMSGGGTLQATPAVNLGTLSISGVRLAQ